MDVAKSTRPLTYGDIKKALISHGFSSESSKRDSYQKFIKSGQRLHVTLSGKDSQGAKKGIIANTLSQSELHRDCLYFAYNCDVLPSVSRS